MHKRTLHLCGKFKKGKTMVRVNSHYMNKYYDIYFKAHYTRKLTTPGKTCRLKFTPSRKHKIDFLRIISIFEKDTSKYELE